MNKHPIRFIIAVLFLLVGSIQGNIVFVGSAIVMLMSLVIRGA